MEGPDIYVTLHSPGTPSLTSVEAFVSVRTYFLHSIKVAGGQFYLDKLVEVTGFSSKVKSSMNASQFCQFN